MKSVRGKGQLSGHLIKWERIGPLLFVEADHELVLWRLWRSGGGTWSIQPRLNKHGRWYALLRQDERLPIEKRRRARVKQDENPPG